MAGNYVLTNDIEIDASTWTYLGSSLPFTGTLDGQGHTIIINGTTSNDITLFDEIGETGVVKNLCGNINLNSTDGWFAFVTLYNYGTIDSCSVEGVANGAFSRVGGFVLNNHGTIKNCYNNCQIYSNGYDFAPIFGGIVGNIGGGKIQNCYNLGNINFSGNNDVPVEIGGIVGYASPSNINIVNCFNLGLMTSNDGSERLGGIIGYDSSSVTIMDCYSSTHSDSSYGTYKEDLVNYLSNKNDFMTIGWDATTEYAWDFDSIWDFERVTFLDSNGEDITKILPIFQWQISTKKLILNNLSLGNEIYFIYLMKDDTIIYQLSPSENIILKLDPDNYKVVFAFGHLGRLNVETSSLNAEWNGRNQVGINLIANIEINYTLQAPILNGIII